MGDLDLLTAAASEARPVAVAMLRGRDPAGVADVVQQVLLVLIERGEAPAEVDELARWVRQVTRNCAHAHLRSLGRAGEPGEPIETATGDAAEQVVASLEAERRLGVLSPSMAWALWQRDAAGESVDRIAQHLSVTVGSARVLLSRARVAARAAVAAAIAGTVRMRRGAAVATPALAAAVILFAGVAPVWLGPPPLGAFDGQAMPAIAATVAEESTSPVSAAIPVESADVAWSAPASGEAPVPSPVVAAGPIGIYDEPLLNDQSWRVRTCVAGVGADVDPGFGKGGDVSTCDLVDPTFEVVSSVVSTAPAAPASPQVSGGF